MRQVLVRFTGFRPVFSDKNSKNLCSDQAEHIHVIPLEPSRSHTTCTYITQELFEGSNFHGLLQYSRASMKIEPTKCCRMPISKKLKFTVHSTPHRLQDSDPCHCVYNALLCNFRIICMLHISYFLDHIRST